MEFAPEHVRRIEALERDSHPPIDLEPAMREIFAKMMADEATRRLGRNVHLQGLVDAMERNDDAAVKRHVMELGELLVGCVVAITQSLEKIANPPQIVVNRGLDLEDIAGRLA